MSATSDFAERQSAILDRIRAACTRVGRDVETVRLIPVSKRHSVETLCKAYDVGIRVFGENQVQEAEGKQAELSGDVDWQFIGPLQSNKAKRAVALFSTLHALDRPKIIDRVEKAAREQGRQIDGFLEVNLGGEDSKHGFSSDGFIETVQPLLPPLRHLRIIGLMAIPPFGADPEASRPWFRKLRTLRDGLARAIETDPDVDLEEFGSLSMGMSGDFEVAIEEGATHIRVGTSLFGARPA